MFIKLWHQKIAMQRQSCICCSHSGIKEVKLISVVVTLSLTYSTSQCRSKQSTLEQTSSKLNESLPGSLSVHWRMLALFPSYNYQQSKPSSTCHIQSGLKRKNKKKESALSMALLQLTPHIQMIDCLTVMNDRISVSMNYSAPPASTKQTQPRNQYLRCTPTVNFSSMS